MIRKKVVAGLKIRIISFPRGSSLLVIASSVLSVVCVLLKGIECSAQAQELTVAKPGVVLSFPRDHGAHPLYQTEWWYYTGQLYQAGQQPFKDPASYGFQVTLFRRATSGAAGVSQDYMAHAALTDVRSQKTIFASRSGGGALGVAGATTSTLAGWSGDWSMDLMGENFALRFSLPEDQSSAGATSQSLVRLLATPSTPLLLQGDRGFSRKGSCPTCASIYYSSPALRIQGSVIQGDASRNVTGIGWMDHEFMSNSLGEQQQGWDWMGLMFRDGRHLMVFQMRDKAGGIDTRSATLRDGERVVSLSGDAISMTPLRRWRSPASSAEYPTAWRVQIPSHSIDVEVSARVQACELGSAQAHGLPSYWEGPVASADEAVLGYLEMTGYSGRIGF